MKKIHKLKFDEKYEILKQYKYTQCKCGVFHIILLLFTLRICLVVAMAQRDGSRTATTSTMERFVIIVNGWKPLTIITKHSILDVVTVLDPPLDLPQQ